MATNENERGDGFLYGAATFFFFSASSSDVVDYPTAKPDSADRVFPLKFHWAPKAGTLGTLGRYLCTDLCTYSVHKREEREESADGLLIACHATYGIKESG